MAIIYWIIIVEFEHSKKRRSSTDRRMNSSDDASDLHPGCIQGRENAPAFVDLDADN